MGEGRRGVGARWWRRCGALAVLHVFFPARDGVAARAHTTTLFFGEVTLQAQGLACHEEIHFGCLSCAK